MYTIFVCTLNTFLKQQYRDRAFNEFQIRFLHICIMRPKKIKKKRKTYYSHIYSYDDAMILHAHAVESKRGTNYI